jgi:hypothetical protein
MEARNSIMNTDVHKVCNHQPRQVVRFVPMNTKLFRLKWFFLVKPRTIVFFISKIAVRVLMG